MALTLPDHVNVGDSGHVADTNLIIAALADLDGRSGGGSTILSGTATPTGAVGAVGNYYLDSDDGVLYGPKMAPAAPQSVYTSQVPSSFTTGVGYSFGNDFTFAVAGRVTGLRFYRHASSTWSTHTLRLWSSPTTQAGNCATTGETGSGWIAASFASPVAVTAGQVMRATLNIADIAPGDYWAHDTTSRGTIVNGNVTVNGQTYYAGAAGLYPTTTRVGTYYIDVIFEAGLDAGWPVALKSIPPGGTTGQILKKTSNADYAVAWVT